MGRVRGALIAAAFFVALLVMYGFDWRMTVAVFFGSIFVPVFIDPFGAYEIGRFLLGRRQDESDR
jgi:hypothetical protein